MSHVSLAHTPPDTPPPGPPVAADNAEPGGERLHHLFRHGLASGRVNPLLYLVALYHARAPT